MNDPLREAASALVTAPDAPLEVRYRDGAMSVLDAEERSRLLDGAGRPYDPGALCWELLYRIEPHLYEALVEGERLHENILDWLPARCERVLEVGAGTGRLTLDLVRRCTELVAVEPAAGLRHILAARLDAAGAAHAVVRPGFFDALPVAARRYDLVVTCSAFSAASLHDPARCLAALEDACAPGGMVVVVWPTEPGWLEERGYQHVSFAGPMLVEYRSVEQAVALARVFYPAAADRVARMGSRFVDPVMLGIGAPRDLCWKRCA